MANKRVKWDKTPVSNAFAQHIILIKRGLRAMVYSLKIMDIAVCTMSVLD